MSEHPSPKPADGPGEADDLADWFDGSPCGHLLTDGDGRLLRVNRTFAAWIGREPSSFVGTLLLDLLPVAGKIFLETHFAPMVRLGLPVDEMALDFVRADGTRMPTLVNADCRRPGDRPGRVRMAVFRTAYRHRYERDLVEARNSAEETMRLEREVSDLREQFIAVLGHDLRNPLAAIASGMRLLIKEPLTARGRRVVELVEGSVVRATGLIDNVLDFARGRLGGGLTLSRDAREPLEPALRQVVAELRAIAPDRTIVADYDLDEPIDCDRGRIGQLLSNLLGNALTHGSKEQPVRITARTLGDRLMISVTNGGSPIPTAMLAHLFHPFVRGQVKSHRDGLGLGLHIASEIAKAHAGTLTVTSDDDATCFTFTMPLPLEPDHTKGRWIDASP